MIGLASSCDGDPPWKVYAIISGIHHLAVAACLSFSVSPHGANEIAHCIFSLIWVPGFPLAKVLKTSEKLNHKSNCTEKKTKVTSSSDSDPKERDLPLIEITGEDDSLLRTTLGDTPTSPTVINYFSSSPLRIPISKLPPVSTSAKALGDSVDRANPTHSSPKSSSDAQNTRTNKVEVPKLSMEPLQMKKRKKGGGYNLRKSLAWDRAFFTEEGVLDPLELSMISGSFGNSCGEALSVISEDSDCSTDSADLQSLEGTSHKEFPSPSLVGDKRKGSCFHMKTDSSARDNASPTSVAAQKIQSTTTHRSRTETKGGGCPRPLASSSLKRPANVNTARAAGKKDSKLPKVPISKPSPTRSKSAILSESHLKHNQIAQPAVNVFKNGGLKSSSKNFKGVQSKAKTGPNCPLSPIKISAQHSGRSLANSPLEVQASTTPLHLSVSKTTNPTAYSSERRHESTVAVSLPQNLNPIAVKMQNRFNQTAKPSGLRMPSPSLGFFGQPKASGSHSLLQKNTQLSNIPKPGTCGLQKFSELRPTSKQSALSVSHKIMKLDLEVNNAQKVEVKVPNEYKSCEPIRRKHEVDDIIDANLIMQEPTKHNKMEKIACEEEAKSPVNDSQVVLQSGSRIQLREDEFQNSSSENHTFVSKSDLGDLGNYGEEISSKLNNDRRVSCITNLNQLSTDCTELSVESQKYEIENKRNSNDEIPECSGSELGSRKVQENEAANLSPVGVPKVWAPHEIISVEKCDRNLSTSAEDKQNFKVGDLSEEPKEHLELKSFCLALEQNSPCNLELHLEDDFSLAKRSFSEESLVEEVIESVESGLLERNDFNRSESSDSELFSARVPDQRLDGRVEMDKTAENPSVVNPENFNDADFNDTEKLIGEITSSDLNVQLSKEPVLSVGNVQKTEVNEPENDVDVEEAEPNSFMYNFLQKSKSTESFNSPPQFQNAEQVKGVIDSVSKISESDTKKDKLVIIKPPSDAVPFSDEWLAAIEAAGEDILTMKGGAVQNSPPDKSQPEPSPWSPVKKKKNQIGPFDCTKCTNTLPAD